MSKRKSPRAATIISGILIDHKQEEKLLKKEISRALDSEIKTEAQDELISANPALVSRIERQKKTRRLNLLKNDEIRDSPADLEQKCLRLAQMIAAANHVMVYTGAGISTAANIPDYRGTGGVWTAINKGMGIKKCNLVTAQPTKGHMALSQLVKTGVIKYVLSQNCDGLHIRSGIPEDKLSEIHGNMFLENCESGCKHYRLFDVTEKTNIRRHKTGRKCPKSDCMEDMCDSIVHFGELNHFDHPYRWAQAYKHLWPKNVDLVIVNLQWTPKDRQAAMTIRGECDHVLEFLAQYFKVKPIEDFKLAQDPLLKIATPLNDSDLKPNTPVVDSVVTQHDFLVEKDLHSKNCVDNYTPGWFGKGMKKS